MKKRITALLVLLVFLLTGCPKAPEEDFGFARDVSAQEQALRLQVVQTAEQYLGIKGGSEKHKALLDIYNTHTPLAQGYSVKESDKWCATFVSAIAISCELTDIIPTECGCQRQIGLFDALDCWEESDSYIPLPGDIIYYCTGNKTAGDCTDWSDHVGIVVGTGQRSIKVIEGNYNNAVRYRIIPFDDSSIRGFGLPDYAGKA